MRDRRAPCCASSRAASANSLSDARCESRTPADTNVLGGVGRIKKHTPHPQAKSLASCYVAFVDKLTDDRILAAKVGDPLLHISSLV